LRALSFREWKEAATCLLARSRRKLAWNVWINALGEKIVSLRNLVAGIAPFREREKMMPTKDPDKEVPNPEWKAA
jgi:hypothetical protein